MLRVTVRVRPGASSSAVGGRYGEGEPPVPLVSVRAPASAGRANEALVEALAEAFGLRRAAVRIVSGYASRTKLVALSGADGAVLDELLAR